MVPALCAKPRGCAWQERRAEGSLPSPQPAWTKHPDLRVGDWGRRQGPRRQRGGVENLPHADLPACWTSVKPTQLPPPVLLLGLILNSVSGPGRPL